MRYICFLLFFPLFYKAASQNVGIGTSNPNSKAILEIKATDKGILFPRLTTLQRDAIANPPNGLHIYNTDEACLNYFDSSLSAWNCYCENDACKVISIRIAADADTINFYERYGKNYPNTKKFVVTINAGVNIRPGVRSGFAAIRPPFDFSSMPSNVTVKIINNGNIFGFGGIGGNGATGDGTPHGSCSNITLPATNGTTGGNAIETKAGVTISISNYGIVAGGAGGGGGGGRTSVGQFGGGGGGGTSFGLGGVGGGYQQVQCLPIVGCTTCAHFAVAQHGSTAMLTTPGAGGTGASGGGNGGSGGALGQPGQAGSGTGAGLGGAVGKAIHGGSGNSITNIGSGVYYGVVD